MKKMEIKYITKNEPLVLDKKDLAKAKPPLDETQNFWELRGVSLNIAPGEAVGVVGTNGSGKETLIDILAGTTKQTTGFITIEGKINRASARRGLDEEKTGLENIRQAISVADLDELKGNHLLNAIVNFTDLGEWLYRPVHSYSIGVYARLSLGIALFVEPKLVLLDNVLGNLDNIFHIKVSQKIQALKDAGVAFVIADTNVFNIEHFCERTIWLRFGEVQQFGPTQEVLEQFEYYINWLRALSLPEKNDFLAKKQKERLTFDVSSVYEEFKIEQFKHGFTRKDEPRMRKAFYKDHGVDPVSSEKEKVVEVKKQRPSKINNKTKYVLGCIAALVIISVIWLSLDNKIFAGWGNNKEEQTNSQKSSQPKQQKAQKQSQPKALADSKAKAASSSSAAAKASSESAAKAASESTDKAKAASESKAALMKNTQTINISDGDTLEGLAQKYATTVDKIKEINNMNANSQLKSGDVIRVPK